MKYLKKRRKLVEEQKKEIKKDVVTINFQKIILYVKLKENLKFI